MATDLFENFPLSFTMPYNDGFAITESDTEDLPQVTRAIYVGGTGNITLITEKGNTIALVGVLTGTILNIRASRVTTATTATNLVGLV